jgi:hypothetical protein
MQASGMLFVEDPRKFAADMASKLGAELEYLGPGEPAPTPPVNKLKALDELREAQRQGSLF